MNADLLRQRRNLIAISTVLLIFDFAQVKIAKVSVLGTELLVGNAQVLIFCAWALLAYFMLRYYQYWRAEPERYIRFAFMRQLEKYAAKYKNGSLEDELGQPLNYTLRRIGFAKWAYLNRQWDPQSGAVVDRLVTPIPSWLLIWWSIKSVFFVGVQTHHATDHVLPFALALSAPAVAICTRWPIL